VFNKRTPPSRETMLVMFVTTMNALAMHTHISNTSYLHIASKYMIAMMFYVSNSRVEDSHALFAFYA
jgi:hypothetical protein